MMYGDLSVGITFQNNGTIYCTSADASVLIPPNNFRFNKPTITPSGPLTFPSGGSVTLTAPSGMVSYSWSNGEITQSIIVTSSMSVTVTIIDSGSCVATSDSVTVNVTLLTTGRSTTGRSTTGGSTTRAITSGSTTGGITTSPLTSGTTTYSITSGSTTSRTTGVTTQKLTTASISSSTGFQGFTTVGITTAEYTTGFTVDGSGSTTAVGTQTTTSDTGTTEGGAVTSSGDEGSRTAIIAGVVGAVGVSAIALVGIIVFISIRKRKNKKDSLTEMNPISTQYAVLPANTPNSSIPHETGEKLKEKGVFSKIYAWNISYTELKFVKLLGKGSFGAVSFI